MNQCIKLMEEVTGALCAQHSAFILTGVTGSLSPCSLTRVPPQHHRSIRLPPPWTRDQTLTPHKPRRPGTMDDVPPIINISISLRIQPNEGPVFFKVDGTRFGQTRTIKLLTGSKYKIEVVVKPGNVEAT